ncbi:AlbA family DNA-binding domain-containing protein [Youngiibacter fragilis]|uniref:AlbA family DNA-binding domain-containing protein n=1 Tax=Youngiibacter fragilis TaxID=1408819 RepID=UPI0026A4CECD
MFVENQTTEFKREFTDNTRKTVIAFANTDGGRLIIGVEDDGTPCGVDDPDGTMQKLTSAIRDSIKPDVTLFTACSFLTVEGKTLVSLDIQRGTSRPYYLAGKGIRPEGVYIRQGTSTVPASETAILGMIRETSGDCYENARSLNQLLTFEKASVFLRRGDLNSGMLKSVRLALSVKMGPIPIWVFSYRNSARIQQKLQYLKAAPKMCSGTG